jgi:hypothetical protein
MSKKQEIISFKTEKTEDGKTVLIAVYAPAGKPKRRICKIRGKQTSDFDLVGGWQRSPFKKTEQQENDDEN